MWDLSPHIISSATEQCQAVGKGGCRISSAIGSLLEFEFDIARSLFEYTSIITPQIAVIVIINGQIGCVQSIGKMIPIREIYCSIV